MPIITNLDGELNLNGDISISLAIEYFFYTI